MQLIMWRIKKALGINNCNVNISFGEALPILLTLDIGYANLCSLLLSYLE